MAALNDLNLASGAPSDTGTIKSLNGVFQVAGGAIDGHDATMGAKADAKSTATDATPITFMQVIKQVSASVQAAAASLATLVSTGITIVNANTNGRKTPANSAPTVAASQTYQDVAASATATALVGGGSGAAGDYLDFLLIVPETVAAGAVSITDGSGSAVTVWAGGGTTALLSLVPFAVPIKAISASGAWKVTTGTNVHARAIGNFT